MWEKHNKMIMEKRRINNRNEPIKSKKPKKLSKKQLLLEKIKNEREKKYYIQDTQYIQNIKFLYIYIEYRSSV